MLIVRYGLTDDTLFDSDAAFDYEYEPEWLKDPMVKDMILDVDKSKVISENVINSSVLGQIPPQWLSGGVKALIFMLKTDEEVWATACGDNCAKWIYKISEMKDLTISLEHFLNFEDCPLGNHFPVKDAETGEIWDDYFDWIIEHEL